LCGKLPQPVFDTQVAAALSGLGDQIGYGALVKDITGVELEKAHTRTDWCQRPLSAAQLHYAREDVLYLRQLQERLSDRLVKLGRQAWLEEEQGTLCDPVTYQNDPRQAYLRLRNLSALPVEVQSRARVLAEWRETFARERNQPRRWILTDQQLLNIAREAPASSAELATVPEVPEKLARRRAPQILQALERASADELQQLPASVMRLSNPQKALAKRMMDKVRECAQANQLAASILATRKDVDALIRGDRELPLLHGWRHELIGRHLLEMMAAEQP
jgi:ribonuclease D